MTTQQLGEEGFRWYIGIVEDIQDPKLLGRIKVRIINEHDDKINTEDLEWAHVMMPTTSASVEGVGDSPNLAVGSNVIGFYMDGNEKQVPMVIGSFPTIPSNDNNKHSLSWLHRGQNIITKTKVGPEPATAYNAQYPYNRTITTKAGHVIELDDTPENTRVHIFHRSGTYIEINNDGRLVIKTVDDSHEIVAKNKEVYVKGNCNIQVDGNLNVLAKGNAVISSLKNMTIAAKGVLSLFGQGGVRIRAGADIAMAAPGGASVTEGGLSVTGGLSSGTGVSGAFTTPTGKTVHVSKGIVSNIT